VLAGPNGAGKSAMAVELLVEVQTALLARARAECAAFVTPGDGSEALRAGLEQGALASLHLIIRGAADGALLGAATGGGAADGAWIGAAVGAGLGLVVGVVTGVGKRLEEQRRHRAAYEACVASRVGEGGVDNSAVQKLPVPVSETSSGSAVSTAGGAGVNSRESPWSD